MIEPQLKIHLRILYFSEKSVEFLTGIVLLFPRRSKSISLLEKLVLTVELLTTVCIAIVVIILIYAVILPAKTDIIDFVLYVLSFVLIMKNLYAYRFQNRLMPCNGWDNLRNYTFKNLYILPLMHKKSINCFAPNHVVRLQLMKKKFYV